MSDVEHLEDVERLKDEIERLRTTKTILEEEIERLHKTYSNEIERLRAERHLWETRTKQGAEIIEENVKIIEHLRREITRLHEMLRSATLPEDLDHGD